MQAAFRDWLTLAIRTNLQERFLPWLVSFNGWKLVNSSIWDGDAIRASIFTTTTPEMTTAKQAAVEASAVELVVINDDNMGDCGLAEYQRQDVNLAHQNGFRIVGERVPGTCSWSDLFAMWQAFAPRPDAFANIEEPDPGWLSQFRILYGPPTEPLAERLYLPVIRR
jgi:hypothetical protein